MIKGFKEELEELQNREWHAINDRMQLLLYAIVKTIESAPQKAKLAELDDFVETKLLVRRDLRADAEMIFSVRRQSFASNTRSWRRTYLRKPLR